jgi:dihydroxyacetone kinase-like predicted kinase
MYNIMGIYYDMYFGGGSSSESSNQSDSENEEGNTLRQFEQYTKATSVTKAVHNIKRVTRKTNVFDALWIVQNKKFVLNYDPPNQLDEVNQETNIEGFEDSKKPACLASYPAGYTPDKAIKMVEEHGKMVE